MTFGIFEYHLAMNFSDIIEPINSKFTNIETSSLLGYKINWALRLAYLHLFISSVKHLDTGKIQACNPKGLDVIDIPASQGSGVGADHWTYQASCLRYVES